MQLGLGKCVCVCVCVCERERERERARHSFIATWVISRKEEIFTGLNLSKLTRGCPTEAHFPLSV